MLGMLSLRPIQGESSLLLCAHGSSLQSSWSASRTLMRFFIISKFEKKIMLTTADRRTDTPSPT
jgi:hypothetical protein